MLNSKKRRGFFKKNILFRKEQQVPEVDSKKPEVA